MAQIKVVLANRVVEGHELGERTVLGRSRDASIVLADPSVSRQHAVITSEGHRYFIEDLGSAAGVRVNGIKTKREQLQQGDVIALGDLNLIFTLETRPPEAEETVEVSQTGDLHPAAPWASARDLQLMIPSTREMIAQLASIR